MNNLSWKFFLNKGCTVIVSQQWSDEEKEQSKINEWNKHYTDWYISRISFSCHWRVHLALPYLLWESWHIKNQQSSFKQTLLTKGGINIDQISILFIGYTGESAEAPEQKQKKNHFAPVEIKVDWNLPIPQNMKHFLAGAPDRSRNWLIGLLRSS